MIKAKPKKNLNLSKTFYITPYAVYVGVIVSKALLTKTTIVITGVIMILAFISMMSISNA
jgi:hypothetical protein